MSALGFYQGSNAYAALSDFATADENYGKRNYIVEGYNLDNYNVNGNQIFTLDDTTAFAGITAWLHDLRVNGRSLILGLIEGISTDSAAYTSLSADQALLMSSTK